MKHKQPSQHIKTTSKSKHDVVFDWGLHSKIIGFTNEVLIALDCSMYLFFNLNPVCPFIQRAFAALDSKETRTQIQKHGHRGIITMDQDSKMETTTTLKAVFIPPKGPGVRLRGMCLCISLSTVQNYTFISEELKKMKINLVFSFHCSINLFQMICYARSVHLSFYISTIQASEASFWKNISPRW